MGTHLILEGRSVEGFPTPFPKEGLRRLRASHDSCVDHSTCEHSITKPDAVQLRTPEPVISNIFLRIIISADRSGKDLKNGSLINTYTSSLYPPMWYAITIH